MKLCLHEATTMTTDFATDVEAYSAAGFSAIEVWLSKVFTYLEEHSLEEARALLTMEGMEAVSAGGSQARLLFKHGEEREAHWKRFQRELEVCQALGASVMVHAMVEAPEEVTEGSYQEAIASLREAADLAAEYDMALALEFIQDFPFCGCLDTAVRLARAVDRPNVGVLFDTFHFYVGISKMADIRELRPGEVKFLHVNDARDLPRELLVDKDRVWLGEGILPLRELLSEIQSTGYEGYVSMELFDHSVWEMDPFQAARKAYENMATYLGTGVE